MVAMAAVRCCAMPQIKRVKARREQYEKEREEKEAKRMEDQRAREAELFGDWKEKEEVRLFVLVIRVAITSRVALPAASRRM